jgi:glyoxylase-like metal-dependent hydrolase (beta-lactamase superfamily II)
VVLSLEAWNSKHLGMFSWREWSPSFTMGSSDATVTTAEVITFSSGHCHSFDGSRDLLGDGSIILLPTPGHADGHLSVLVQMDRYQLLLVADVMYTLRHLAVDQVRQIMLGKRMQAQQIDSIRRLQQLREVLPEMVIVPTHDHTAYQFQYIDPFLPDEERQEIKAYEARVFDEAWRLVPGALPHFVAPPENGHVGAVTEP